MWSKIKTAMRAAKARTREELERAFKAALELVTESDCSSWFTHRGYQVTPNCLSYSSFHLSDYLPHSLA